MLKLFRNTLVASFFSLVFSLFFMVQAAQLVDINTADAATMAEGINGIGPSKAEAIVEYRTKNGRFISVNDLVNVQGIGEKTLDRIRQFVSVSPNGVSNVSGAAATESATSTPVVTEQPALQAN